MTRLNKKDPEGEKVGRLTNREDVSLSTDHLIRLSRNEDILPDVYRAACINSNSREGREECGNVEPVAV